MKEDYNYLKDLDIRVLFLFASFTSYIMRGDGLMLTFIISLLGVLLTMLGLIAILVLIGAGYVIIKLIAYAIPIIIILMAVKFILDL